MSVKQVIELDLSSIVAIINPKGKFLYCPDKDSSIEIKVSKMDSDYNTLAEGMDRLMDEAQNDSDWEG
jgi:hypothetical protein